MAQFTNPELPEEVNNSDVTPLRSFATLLLSAVLLTATAVAMLVFFAGTAARFVPYSAEASLIGPYAAHFPPREDAVEAWLQGIADRLVKDGAMALPQGMQIRVHFVDQPAVNAFATLGGHVAVYRGLLERVPDENVLAMVLAHEIAHAQHRHPIASLGRGITLGAAVSLLSVAAGGRIAESVLGPSGMLTLLSFSRAQEEEADATGVVALARVYGHAGGATQTFEVLQNASRESGRAEPPKFLSTHPVTAERIARLAGIIAKSGWKNDGERQAVPDAVGNALQKDAK